MIFKKNNFKIIHNFLNLENLIKKLEIKKNI